MSVSRLRREAHGFTMVEMLAVMLISGIVLTGVANLMQMVMRQTTGIVSRTDASQRGRLVMDQITRELRSQVCLDLGHPSARPALESASANSITFFTDLSDGTRPPVKRQLVYDTANTRIVEYEYGATTGLGVTPSAFSTTPTRTRVLLQNVTPTDSAGLFSFKKYTGSGRYDTATAPVTPPLTAADLAAVANITIAMDVRPGNAKDASVFTRLSDSVLIRNLSVNYSPSNPDALRCE